MANTTEVKAKEKFDVGKLIRGFLPTQANIGKMLWVIVISTIVSITVILGMKVMQRTEHTVQTADAMTNITQTQPGFRVLGIELFGWRK